MISFYVVRCKIKKILTNNTKNMQVLINKSTLKETVKYKVDKIKEMYMPTRALIILSECKIYR